MRSSWTGAPSTWAPWDASGGSRTPSVRDHIAAPAHLREQPLSDGFCPAPWRAGVARAVLEHTTHSLLVGDKAARFAEMAGFAREDLNTSRSEALDAAWRAQACQPSFFVGFADQDDSCPPYHLPSGPRGPPAGTGRAAGRGESVWVGRDTHDTIGMVARDKRGRFAAGTSSNGASHKVAGRVGDAAIAGAGAYADDAGGARPQRATVTS